MTSDIILISGWGCDQNIWLSLQKKIKANHHYFNWQLYLENNDALLSFLDQFQKVVIISWSLGSIIALKAALQKPNKIEKIILLSPTARMTKDQNYSGVNNKILETMTNKLTDQRQELIDNFAANCFSPEPADNIFATMSSNFTTTELKKGLEFLNSSDLRSELHKIKTPTMILHGTKDKIIPLAQSKYLAENLTQSSFKKVNTGHALPFFLTTELLTDIESFINEQL